MNFLKSKRSILFLGGILLIITAWVKNPRDAYSQYIGGDAKAYYAYLPALFIYQDFDYTFVDAIEEKHYNNDPGLRKDFLNDVENGKVNKTFPGAALLYLPFFLIAHFLSLLTSFSADGYSYFYQWVLPVSHIFYYTLSLLALRAIWIHKNWSFSRFWWIVLALTLGTQLGYYLVLDLTLIHLFGWAVLLFIIYFMHQYYKAASIGLALILGFLAGLLVVLRPTNILAIMFIPFVSLPLGWKWQKWKPLLLQKMSWLMIIAMTLPFIFMMLLWYLQSGDWIVYSYGEEGFDFTNPHWVNFTFGFEKGWLLYAPLYGILILIIFVHWLRQRKIVQSLYWLTSWVLISYIFSCWWFWNYGFGFSQRVMIEYSVFLIFPLARVQWKRFIPILLVPLIALCSWQSYQVRFGVLPGGVTTKEIYMNHFFDATPNAFCIVPEDYHLMESIEWPSEQVKVKENAFGFNYEFKNERKIVKGDLMKITMHIKLHHKNKALRIVLSDQKAQIYQPYFFSEMVDQNQFTKVEYGLDMPQDFEPNKQWALYIWDPETATPIWTKDVSVAIFRKD